MKANDLICTSELPERLESLIQQGYHLVLPAALEENSLLMEYLSHFKLSEEILKQFIYMANDQQQAGTLHPVVPLSIIPTALLEPEAAELLITELCEMLHANDTIVQDTHFLLSLNNQVSPAIIRQALERSPIKRIKIIYLVHSEVSTDNNDDTESNKPNVIQYKNQS